MKTTYEREFANSLGYLGGAGPEVRLHLLNMADAIDVLTAECNHARARFDNAVKLLSSIHMLLYPAPIKIENGNTMVFRPKNLDPHEVLQELSDRIRALPDEIQAIAAAAIGEANEKVKVPTA